MNARLVASTDPVAAATGKLRRCIFSALIHHPDVAAIRGPCLPQ